MSQRTTKAGPDYSPSSIRFEGCGFWDRALTAKYRGVRRSGQGPLCVAELSFYLWRSVPLPRSIIIS